MRKHDVRKWLHAFLDLLPLVVIPVFMVYSHRHTINDYSVTRDEPLEVIAYQGVINGKPASLEYWSSYQGTLTYLNNDECIEADLLNGSVYIQNTISVNVNDYVYLSFDIKCDDAVEVYSNFSLDDNLYFYEGDLQYYQQYDNFSCLVQNTTSDTFTDERLWLSIAHNGTFYIKNVQYFNLTTIFGSGNEPTKEVFESYLTQDYYPYGNNNLIAGTHSVTYDSTDIGNQMFYSLYNTVEEQFNFTRVWNFGDLYNFLNLNLFGGNSPLAIFVVYNIIVYEFLMDMLFIIYGVFMFLIDFIENLMENVFARAKKGGSC